MRIFLTILLAIFLLLVLIVAILCLVSVTVSLEWWNGNLKWNVRLWGIKLLPRKKKKTQEAPAEETEADPEAEQKPKKEKKPKKEPKQKADPADKPKEFFMDKLGKLIMKITKYSDLAANAFYAIPKPLRKIGKAFTLSHVRTDIVIADEDAGKCARQYGMIQLFMQQFLYKTGKVINVRRKRVQIVCDFTADESRWNVGFRLKFRLGPVLAAAVIFLWHFLWDMHRAKKAVISKKL